jgi:hypothetical protein
MTCFDVHCSGGMLLGGRFAWLVTHWMRAESYGDDVVAQAGLLLEMRYENASSC